MFKEKFIIYKLNKIGDYIPNSINENENKKYLKEASKKIAQELTDTNNIDQVVNNMETAVDFIDPWNELTGLLDKKYRKIKYIHEIVSAYELRKYFVNKINEGYKLVKKESLSKKRILSSKKIIFVWEKNGKKIREIPPPLLKFKKYFNYETKKEIEAFDLDKLEHGFEKYLDKEFSKIITILKDSKYYENTVAVLTKEKLLKGHLGKEWRAIIRGNYFDTKVKNKPIYKDIKFNKKTNTLEFVTVGEYKTLENTHKHNLKYNLSDYNYSNFNYKNEDKEETQKKLINDKEEPEINGRKLTKEELEDLESKFNERKEKPPLTEEEIQFDNFQKNIREDFNGRKLEDFNDDDFNILEGYDKELDVMMNDFTESNSEIKDEDGTTPMDKIIDIENFLEEDIDNEDINFKKQKIEEILKGLEKMKNEDNNTINKTYWDMFEMKLIITALKFGIDID